MTPPDFTQALHEWQNFYTLLGEASATLTGLMFIAASLGTSLIDDKAGPKVQTFITPTVLYFSLALLLSALMNIPTQTRPFLTAELGSLGLLAGAYSVSHLGRLHTLSHQGTLTPGDWAWIVAAPLFASLWLLGAAFALHRSALWALDAEAVGVLLLVMIGLHNAWDVTLRLIRMTPNP